MGHGKFGVASIILGILGFLAFFTPYTGIGVLLCIVGAILAVVSLEDSHVRHGAAKVGMLCSLAGIVVPLLVLNLTNSRGPVKLEKDGAQLVDSPESSSSAAADEKEVFHDNDISIAVTGMETSGTQTTVNFKISSEADKDYAIAAHSYAVNGVTAKDDLYEYNSVDVMAGEEADTSISIANSWLAGNGIEDLSDLDVVFWAYDGGVKEWDTGEISISAEQIMLE
jgi:hypothetical protein